jgi:hypothetical protein
MAKITYNDKTTLNPQPSISNENKVTSDDMNEIKNVVNTNDDNTNANTTSIENLQAFTLYTSQSGEEGNITLSDSAANYSRIDVFILSKTNSIYNTYTIYEPNGKTLEVRTGNMETGLNDYYMFQACSLSFNGTSITRSYNRIVSLRNGQTPSISTSSGYYKLGVLKVIGYK